MKAGKLVTLIACGALVAPVMADDAVRGDSWSFSLLPYLWVPGIDAKLKYGPPVAGGNSPNVSVEADTLLESIDMAAMIAGEARKGRWLIALDAMYLNLGQGRSAVRSVDFDAGSGPVNVATSNLSGDVKTDLHGSIWTLLMGYEAISSPGMSLDVVTGGRYLHVHAKTDWQLATSVAGPAGSTSFARTGSVEKSDDLWTAVVGVKGRVMLGTTNWYLHYYADIGGGSSVRTYQGVGGVGYAFKWGDVVFDYRYLHYGSGEHLVQDLSAGGPALGVRFRF